MTAITRDDYIQAFGLRELIDRCDRDGDGQEDAGVFDGTAAMAEAEVQGYVNARPVGIAAPADVLLKRVSLDVVRYLLFRQRMDPDVKAAYDAAVQLLRAIASGRISPVAGGAGSAESAVQITAGDVQFTTPSPTFNRCTLGDY